MSHPPLTPEEAMTTEELAAAMRPALLRLARRLRQMRDSSVDLAPNELSAMAVLLNEGDKLMGELAAAELVQPPSMTRIVNGLEQRGYVVRQPAAGDRRQCVVSIAPPDREALLANRRRRDAWLAERLADLSPEERDILARAMPVLEKVNRA